MKLKIYKSAGDYLEENLEDLEKDEPTNSMIIGLSLLNEKNNDCNSTYLAIRDDNALLFSLITTNRPRILVCGDLLKYQKYETTLIEYLQQEKIEIAAIKGPKKLAFKLRDSMNRAFNWKSRTVYYQMLYFLEAVKQNPNIKGRLKKVGPREVPKVAKWFSKFYIEALGWDDEKSAHESAMKKIENGQVYVWHHNTEVAMASVVRPTKNGITITLVYTPQEYRNRGYGTKLVAELSQLMMEEGYQFCTLFADLENPSSNSIYQQIGYLPIKEFKEIEFIKNE